MQTKLDFEDKKLQAVLQEKDKETERMRSEKDLEIRALKNELEVRNVIMSHINFTDTLTCKYFV
jgi:hypothetical protein